MKLRNQSCQLILGHYTACLCSAYAHERKPFFSRAQTLFIVSANLFYRDEKPPSPNVVAAKSYAAQL